MIELLEQDLLGITIEPLIVQALEEQIDGEPQLKLSLSLTGWCSTSLHPTNQTMT